MNYNALKSAVEDTMKWEPDTVVLSLYETPEHTTTKCYDLKQWVAPQHKIPPAFKQMSPMLVHFYTYV